jgi:hypothetical protein
MKLACPRHPVTLLALVVIALHFGFVLWWVWTSFAVVDEVGHLGSGLATWRTGDTRPYCVNPPLPRLIATVPIWAADPELAIATGGAPGSRPEWSLGVSLARDNPDRYVGLVRAARLTNLVWDVLLLVVLWRWSGELYGPWGRLIAVAVWGLEPSAITFSGVVVPDVPAAAAGLLASYLFWRYLRSPDRGMAWFAGLALGLALSTKLTWLILFAVWAALILAARLHGVPGTAAKPRFRHLLISGAAAWLVFCAGYGFAKFGRPLGEFQFVSGALGGSPTQPGKMPEPGNRFHETALAQVPVPLPADALIGFDIQKYDFERGLYSYLNGEWRQRGWWYYYLYAMAIKLPLPILLLILAGVFWCLVAPRSPGRVDEWAFLLPAAGVIAVVSSQTGFNHHMRYVLPAFPLLAIAAGRLAPLAAEQKWLRGAVAAIFVWCVTAVGSVAPHFMSYFNPLGGGPEGGWRHLIDSNIDWGQDLLFLKSWLADHPDARPMRVQYYNLMQPRDVGLDIGPAPREPEPGWFAVDVNYVAGSPFHAGTQPGSPTPGPYWYFQRFEPVDRAGHSILIYHIAPDDANRVRAELGLPPWVEPEGRP